MLLRAAQCDQLSLSSRFIELPLPPACAYRGYSLIRARTALGSQGSGFRLHSRRTLRTRSLVDADHAGCKSDAFGVSEDVLYLRIGPRRKLRNGARGVERHALQVRDLPTRAAQ